MSEDQIYEKTYLLDEIYDYLENNIDLYFFGSGTDERDKYLKGLFLEKYPEKSFIFKYDTEREVYRINDDEREFFLKKDFYFFMDNLVKNRGSKILIDITSMPVPFMFFILSSLKEIKVQSVFCAYTKPNDYKKKERHYSYKEQYDLSEKFSGIKTLPGFLRSDRHDRDQLLVMFLGYEGRRSSYIYEEEMPSSHNTIPIIGLPAYQAGYNGPRKCDTIWQGISDTNLEVI